MRIINPLNAGMTPIFSKEKRYVVFDWSNVVHRAFAVGGDTAMQLLAKMMVNYRKQFPSSDFVYALEGNGTEVRREILPEYKMHRKRNPAVEVFMKDSIRLLQFTECSLIKASKGEADDAIATFVKNRGATRRIVIISEDTDLWQLIKSPAVTVYSKKKGTVTEEICLRRFSVMPAKIPMIKAFWGDKSDGIPPAIPRLGKAVAVQIVASVTNPEEILEAIKEADWSSPKLAEKIVNNHAEIARNVSLITLKNDLKLKKKRCQSDWHKLSLFLHDHGATALDETDTKIVAG